ncbi:MAG: hypothetical protein ACYCYF_07120, partial [Anaerolineae bacterium]
MSSVADTAPVADAIVVGSTRPALSLQWLKSDGSPLVLTGAAWAGKMREQSSAALAVTLGGSFAVTDAANGKFTYSWVTADTATAGMWLVQVTATISTQTYRRFFWQPIEAAL